MQTSTSLLVIDLQRGAFDGVRCPPVDAPERLIGNARKLVAAARAGGHRVVFVQHCEGAGTPFEEGNDHWLLHQSLLPAADDALVKKRASSSFEGTDLGVRLEAMNVGELVLCGLQSEFCVTNTARSALQLGYTVRVARDAHGTWPWQGRSAAEIADEANSRLAQAGALLDDTESLAAALRRERL